MDCLLGSGHLLALEEGTLELLPVPFLGLLLRDAVLRADSGLAVLAAGNAVAGTLEDDIDVHTMDTNIPVVLEAKIDVLFDTETEVAGAGEATLVNFVIVDLESLVEDLEGLRAADGHVGGDLVVTADAELGDGTMGAGKHGLLTCELLDDTRGTSDLVTDGARVGVDANLRNTDLAELVLLRHEKGQTAWF